MEAVLARPHERLFLSGSWGDGGFTVSLDFAGRPVSLLKAESARVVFQRDDKVTLRASRSPADFNAVAERYKSTYGRFDWRPAAQDEPAAPAYRLRAVSVLGKREYAYVGSASAANAVAGLMASASPFMAKGDMAHMHL